MSLQPTSSTVVADDPLPVVPAQMHEALALVDRIGGQELLSTVVRLFRATSDDRMGKFHDALSEGDSTRVSRLAHAMKGSAGQVGAEGLRTCAAALEEEAVALDSATLAVRIQDLGHQVKQSWVQLEAYQAERRGK